eukprot:jgi/Mesvir1/29721/Mv00951-RA.2
MDSDAPVEIVPVLAAAEDDYHGMIVDPEGLPAEENFVAQLQASLATWKSMGKRGVWLHIPIAKSALVHPAVQAGFVYHHAEKGYVMLTHWLADDKPNHLPTNATHQVGVGALVFNRQGDVLVVKEKNGPLRLMSLWKMPTGIVEAGEELAHAAEREVREETGVQAEFCQMVCFR